MLHYIKKDLLSIDRGVIAHGCNYHGVMGAGVAALIKKKYPKAFKDYSDHIIGAHEHGINERMLLGTTQISEVGQDLFVANCFTQGLERIDGQLATPDAIHTSLANAFAFALDHNLPLYLPKIGAGLGGLSWENDVEPIVNKVASISNTIDTYVCVYP